MCECGGDWRGKVLVDTINWVLTGGMLVWYNGIETDERRPTKLMEITEYQWEALQRTLDGLRQDIRELQYKVQQLEYYKAEEKHSHPEYERR